MAGIEQRRRRMLPGELDEAQLLRIALGVTARRVIHRGAGRKRSQITHLQDEIDGPAGLALPAAQDRIEQGEMPVNVADDRNARHAFPPRRLRSRRGQAACRFGLHGKARDAWKRCCPGGPFPRSSVEFSAADL